MIAVRNIHDPVSDHDGFRVFIEPSWPDGVSIRDAVTDLWFRDLAPDPELYALFREHRVSWEDFLSRYHEELDGLGGFITDLMAYVTDGGLTVLHGSQDPEYNIATALKSYLDHKTKEPAGRVLPGLR